MAMIVQCNQCGTKFKVDETRVGPSGAKVRCTKCKNVFAVTAPAAKPAAAPPPALPGEDDDFGNKTQMYKADTLSGEMLVNSRKAQPAGTAKAEAAKAAAAKPGAAKPAAPVGAPAASPPKRASPRPMNYDDGPGEKTNVVDTSAYLKGLRVPEMPGSAPQEDQPTRVGKVADLAKLAAQDEPEDSPTRVGKMESLAKLTAIAEEPGALEDVDEAHGVEVTQLPPPEPSAQEAAANKAPERRGRLGSEENPVPVANKGDFRVPTQSLAVGTSVLTEADLARGKQLNKIISGGAAAVLALGFLFYGFSERIYSSLRGGSLPEVQLDTATDLQGVRLTRTRTLLYPMKNGSAALLVAGEAVNQTEQPQTDLDVVVELRDRTGKPAKSANVPLGMLLDMEQVVAAQSQADWQELILEWRRKAPPAPVQPSVPTPFLAVLVDPPQPLGDYAQNIHLAPTQPLPPPAVPEPPPPVVEPPPPPPPAPAPVAEAPKVEKKGKKVGKTGKKGHKSSRRAADE